MNKHFFELSPRTRRIIWAALLARWQHSRQPPASPWPWKSTTSCPNS